MLDTFPFLGFDLTNPHLRKAPHTPPFVNVLTNSTTKEYQIEIAVAGYDKKDLDITFDYGTLTITGNGIGRDLGSKDWVYEHKGITQGKFTKSFIVSNGLQLKEVVLNNGILTIALSTPDKPRSSKITIN